MDEKNERLRNLRKKLKMSQEEFGKWLGITKSGVSEIEAGRRKVTEQHIIMLKAHNVNEHWLRTGEGDPFCPMDRQMEIAQLTNQLLTEADDSFKNIVISALSNTSEEDWKAFERFIDRIIEEKKKAE